MTEDPKAVRKSALALAIEEANATEDLPTFDIERFFDLAGKPVGRVKVRVPVNSAKDEAVIRAHEYADRVASRSKAAALDGDILGDGKQIELLFDAMRDADDSRRRGCATT
jgi:hypothetical protein